MYVNVMNINTLRKKKYCESVLILFLTFTVILKRGGIHLIHEDKTELEMLLYFYVLYIKRSIHREA